MSNPPPLDVIQRWMQSVITHPAGVAAGVDGEEARVEIAVSSDEAEQIIGRSKALTSLQRLEIYGNAYYARLLECLSECFPALTYALGDENFNEFAFGYLQSHPSQSYTLNRLGDNFARYLAETRPDRAEHEQGEVSWPDFLIDLATLEWAIDGVFDGPGVEDEELLDADTIASIDPDRWPAARLVPVVCLRLLEFRYPVNAYFTAFRQGEQPELPEPVAEYVALTRINYVVRRFDLGPAQFALLSALVAGKPVGEAIEQAAVASEDDLGILAAKLNHWFADWSAAGFFHRVEL